MKKFVFILLSVFLAFAFTSPQVEARSTTYKQYNAKKNFKKKKQFGQNRKNKKQFAKNKNKKQRGIASVNGAKKKKIKKVGKKYNSDY